MVCSSVTCNWLIQKYTRIFEELFGDNYTLTEKIPDYDAADMLTAFEMKKI